MHAHTRAWWLLAIQILIWRLIVSVHVTSLHRAEYLLTHLIRWLTFSDVIVSLKILLRDRAGCFVEEKKSWVIGKNVLKDAENMRNSIPFTRYFLFSFLFVNRSALLPTTEHEGDLWRWRCSNSWLCNAMVQSRSLKAFKKQAISNYCIGVNYSQSSYITWMIRDSQFSTSYNGNFGIEFSLQLHR